MNFYKFRYILFFPLFILSILSEQLFAVEAAGASTVQQVAPSVEAPQKISTTPTTVIFDLGGVLFDTSRTGLSGELHCYWDFVRYAFHLKSPSKIKDVAFSVFDSIFGKQVVPEGNSCAMADGIAMPRIMCEWMCGTPSSDIVTLVNTELDTNRHDKLFSCAVEKQLVKRLANVLFDPAVMAKHTHPIKGGREILELCTKRENLTLMVLSNYAADAFEELYNREEAQTVFRNFAPEKLVISGFIGHMKPYRSIYDYLIKEYHLDPTTCLIIDDQKENILAAKNAGFQTIWVKKGNFGAVRKRLEKMGVIATQ